MWLCETLVARQLDEQIATAVRQGGVGAGLTVCWAGRAVLDREYRTGVPNRSPHVPHLGGGLSGAEPKLFEKGLQ